MAKRNKVRLLGLIILGGLVAALVFHGVMRFGLHTGYPQNTFLFRADDRFNDFFNPLRGSFDRDPYNPDRITFIGGYLPFGYVVAFLFSLVLPAQLSLALFLGGFLVFLGVYVTSNLQDLPASRHLKDRLPILGYAVCIAYLTYPTLFLVDRANLDGVILVLIALFALLYQRGHLTLAVVVLSPAIAMKGYPAILLSLPLLDRRYKELLLASFLAALLTLGGLAIFHDGMFAEAQKMVVSFQRASAIAFGAGSLVRFNSSLYTALLFLLGRLGADVAQNGLFNVAYLMGAAAVWAVCMLVMQMWKAPFWARMSAVTALMILLPQSSGDYRLVMLYPALMAFVNNPVTSKADWVLTVVLGLLMVPKAYLTLESDVNISLLLNPLLLTTLLLSTLALTRSEAIMTPLQAPTSVPKELRAEPRE